MRARKCDRCNCFYDQYVGKKANAENANALTFIDRDEANLYWQRRSVDLCPTCMKEIIKFLTPRSNRQSKTEGVE